MGTLNAEKTNNEITEAEIVTQVFVINLCPSPKSENPDDIIRGRFTQNSNHSEKKP